MPEMLLSYSALGAGGGAFERSIGPKVDHAALLRTVVGGGCPMAVHHMDGES